MACRWTPQAQPYSVSNTRRNLSTPVKSGAKWKRRLSVLVKRALNMSHSQSGCSRQSRVLLAAMRSQLAIALEQRQLASLSGAETGSLSSVVSCNSCGGFMVQPVCMPCGHSVCKSCMDKSSMLKGGDSISCPKCSWICPKAPQPAAEHKGREVSSSSSSSSSYRTPTLTLQNAFRKWHPKWVESCRRRGEGNQHANKGDFVLAALCYTQALDTGKWNGCWVSRAHAR